MTTLPDIARFKEIEVDEARSWEHAVADAGPNPNMNPEGHDWDINAIDGQFPTKERSEVVRVVLVNFGPDGTRKIMGIEALAWAITYCLYPVSPRTVFALSAKYPALHTDIGWEKGKDGIIVPSLIQCRQNNKRLVCCARWDSKDDKHGACLRPFDTKLWCHRTWFAFTR